MLNMRTEAWRVAQGHPALKGQATWNRGFVPQRTVQPPSANIVPFKMFALHVPGYKVLSDTLYHLIAQTIL